MSGPARGGRAGHPAEPSAPPLPPLSPLCIHGATVIGPAGPVERAVIRVENGELRSIDGEERHACPAGALRLDGIGLVLTPGFVDLQLNGASGIDVTAAPDRIWEAAASLPRLGITAFLPTIISAPAATIATAQRTLMAGPPPGFLGARPLGLHLEGPFLAPSRRGVHDERFLRPPDPGLAAGWSPERGVRMVTLAPELPGAIPLISALAERGVVVSAGHSAASLAEGMAGIEAGVRCATHVFNAMPALDRREPGLIAAVLLDERVTAGFIVDGIHVAPEVLALAGRVIGLERFLAVSDATAALGMAPGVYRLGDLELSSDGVTARLGDGRLAGSVLRLDQALRNVRAFLGWSIADAVATITSVPARLLGGADRCGVLVPGRPFDAVLLTPELEIVATFVAGRIAHAAEALASRLAAVEPGQP